MIWMIHGRCCAVFRRKAAFPMWFITTRWAKVSIVGAGMLGSPGAAAEMFGALGDAGINIDIISTSEISISCLIGEKT